jgi:hypothetical protein
MAQANSKGLLRRFPYTAAALALALIVILVAPAWDISGFDLPGIERIGIDRIESDIITMAFLLVMPAFFVDLAVASQKAHVAHVLAEQLRVLRVTMRTVQDIVNNNLNQLQLLRLEAEGHVSGETLALFDKTIEDTAAELTALGNMAVFVEKPMAIGSGLATSRRKIDALNRRRRTAAGGGFLCDRSLFRSAAFS